MGSNPDSNTVAKNGTHKEDYSSPEWAQSLSNLSTPLLNSKLTTLKQQSATLASTLTAKLASSPSGQSLLHIGPSLSTLPPDLQSLLSTLQPLLGQVEEYEKMNQTELIRIVTAGKLIEAECRRAANAKECNALLNDLIAAEEIIATGFDSLPSNNHNNADGDGSDAVDEYKEKELNYMVSLERISHTILHLVHELQKSSEQVTSSLVSNNNNNNNNNNGSIIQSKQNQLTSSVPSMDTPLPQDTEKAQFMMKLAPRIRTLERGAIQAISNQLERVLNERVKTMKEQDNDNSVNTNDDVVAKNNDYELLILGYLFRSFALLGKGREAESIFARVAIMPIVRSKVTLGKLDEGGSRGQCAGLFLLLEDLVCSIKDMWGDVLNLVEGMFQVDFGFVDTSIEDDDGEQSIEIDLVTAGVWVPIATALMTDPAIQMAIFSPGIANILQANYVALDTFLSELAANLLKPTSSTQNETSKSNIALNGVNNDEMVFKTLYFNPEITVDTISIVQSRLYKHSMTSDFAKKWNLPIYYQLRFGEACARLDKAIEQVQNEGWDAAVFKGSPDVAKSLKESFGFEIPFFMEVYDIMSWLWQDNVFLRPLTHRFLRGSIQLLGRVISFIEDGLKGDIKFCLPTDIDNENKIDGDILNSASIIDESFYWNERNEDVAAVSWDLTILASCITHNYVNKVASIIVPTEDECNGAKEFVQKSDSHEIRSLVESALVEATDEIPPIIEKFWNEVIVNILTSQCSEPLVAVKGVAATYRMTNRPPPTQASPFVGTILRPLKEFTDSFANRIPPQVGSDWKRRVVASVAEKYFIAVSELIETVQRTEEALKNRKARRTAAGGMSDGEKVKLQLLLDQREFSSNVIEIGIPTDIEYVQKLIGLTKSAETLISKS